MSDETPPYDGLFNSVVRRLRAAQTMFGQRIKLAIRIMSDDQWALLKPPYLLVVPTVTRVEGVGRSTPEEEEFVTNPRSITFLAQLDGRGSEADWQAAIDIEIAERQLLSALVNWRPQPHFRPTRYAGMRIEATKAPFVKVAFVFTFFEELAIVVDDDCVVEGPSGIRFRLVGCGNLVQAEIDAEGEPCAPCEPCAPNKAWEAAMWLNAKGDDDG